MARRTHKNTVTDKAGNTVVTETYWSLREELRTELEDRWKPVMAAAFPNGIGSITNIDEFRAEFDMERATRMYWRQNGLTTVQINKLRDTQPQMYRMMWLLTRFIVEATFWHWNGIPGVEDSVMDLEEPV